LSTNIYAIFDTGVFLRALGNINPHTQALEHLKERCNIIRFSNIILREYKVIARKLGMSPTLLISKSEELKKIGKFKKINQYPLRKAKMIIKKNRLPVPKDKYDVKFIEAALASKAKYIVTIDRGMLNLNPYCYDSENIEIISPETYQTR